jgi:pyrroline-5-carboxylate reductase
MFAVKPYQIANVLPHLKNENYNLEKTVFISIMVGIEEEYFRGFLGA